MIAIRRAGGEPIDLVEMHPEDYQDLIEDLSGPLESHSEVILELMHPTTCERVTMCWPRFTIDP